MDFWTAVKTRLGKYVTFAGRARRAEYWWFVLFEILANAVAAVIDQGGTNGAAEGVVGLVLLLPGLAVAVRRLHDLGRSGWWLLISLVPLIGVLVLLVWDCRRGTPGPNRHGPDPLSGAVFT